MNNFTTLHPEVESADSGVPSGTCADGRGDAPSALFYSEAPLTAQRLGDWSAEDRPRARRIIRSVLFWTGEIVACASLFIIPIVLLFLGEILK